jgi:hypothetical protein
MKYQIRRGAVGRTALFACTFAFALTGQIRKVETPVQAINLSTQETLGGHTLERHVGKDAEFIKTRVLDEGHQAASTFRDQPTATAMVQATLDHNKKDINNHIFNACAGAANQAYRYDAGHDIGSYLETGNLQDNRGRERKSAAGKALKTGAQSVTVVLRYNCAAAPHTFIVLTAFPIPPQ